MSALTDLFQSMANKIRSKTGTATTYTPPQMVSDGIDDVFDAGVASATTSITPSNSSPVAMSANTGYKPTASGYAISSYDAITPTSTSYNVIADEIIKFEGRGVVVDELISLTPSNSSPDTITVGKKYSALTSGVAIYSYSSITPSDSSPVTLSSGSFYKMNGAGKAVASVTAKTPSDTSPASVTSGSIIKPSSAGYLVKTVSDLGGTPDKWYKNDTAPSSGSVDITVTKKPRYIILGVWTRTNTYQGMVGIIDVTKNQAYRMGYFTSAVAESWTNYTSYFTTISSTKVTYSYAGFSGNSRVQILIYY